MHDRNWERVAGYAGLAAVILFVVPTFVGTGTFPKPSDPDTVFKSYLVAHHSAVMRAVWFNSMAAVLVLWLGSGVRSTITRHDDTEASLATTVFAFFVAAAVTLGISFALEGGLAYKAVANTSPSTVRALNDIGSVIGTTFLGVITAIAAALVAVAALSSRALPAYVGWTAAAAAAANLAGSLTIFTNKGFYSLEGAFGFVSLIVTMIWLISLSVALIRPAEATAPAMAPAMPTS
ncbi:MAG TPA: hypothetical protein VFA11_01930 [Acidimicrobiales bacterium]|nr:hypothetical protein [Acidimicrobiales bacterium]